MRVAASSALLSPALIPRIARIPHQKTPVSWNRMRMPGISSLASLPLSGHPEHYGTVEAACPVWQHSLPQPLFPGNPVGKPTLPSFDVCKRAKDNYYVFTVTSVINLHASRCRLHTISLMACHGTRRKFPPKQGTAS